MRLGLHDGGRYFESESKLQAWSQSAWEGSLTYMVLTRTNCMVVDSRENIPTHCSWLALDCFKRGLLYHDMLDRRWKILSAAVRFDTWWRNGPVAYVCAWQLNFFRLAHRQERSRVFTYQYIAYRVNRLLTCDLKRSEKLQYLESRQRRLSCMVLAARASPMS